MIRASATMLALACALAACVPLPVRDGGAQHGPDTAGSEVQEEPRVRGLQRPDASREEPGVGVGGLMHDAPAPAR